MARPSSRSPTARLRLPPRASEGHKGTFGTVTVVGGCCHGSRRYIGAPALAALGALRSGCGLCRVLAPAPILPAILSAVTSATGEALSTDRTGSIGRAGAVRSLVLASADSRCIVAGPGLGSSTGVDALVRWLWTNGGSVPLVLDADGLNSLASMKKLPPAAGPCVVTPHPGEARRLMKALGIKLDPYEPDQRQPSATQLAARLGCTVVLKGPGTIVTDGTRLFVNDSGGPWLATGGTGDVLAGVIGGLVGQHQARRAENGDLFDVVCAAVAVHGCAGDAWARSAKATGGMLAAELAALIPREVERLRGKAGAR